MGKATKWLRNLFTKKKTKEKSGEPNPDCLTQNIFSSVPATATKENRWSFRRSVEAAKELNLREPSFSEPCHGLLDSEIDQKRRAMAVAVATAAAAEAAVIAAQAAAAVVRLTTTAHGRTNRAIEDAAAIKIQSFFRSYLARKALNALKGLVKMQALVRGHLVRKQADATLRCMEALVKAQDRARAERIRLVEASQSTPPRQQNYRRSPQHLSEKSYSEEEYVKIVEMDLGGRSYSMEGTDQRFSAYAYNSSSRTPNKADLPPQFSPAPSAEFSFATTQHSPQLSAMSMPTYSSFDCLLYPNYMANTESSRAKLRSQSAPKQRLDAYERQSSKRRSIPRGIRMQRSSSHVGLAGNNSEYPWCLKLDKSNMSLIESECGSTSTVLTDKNCCRSVAGYEIHGND